MSPRRRFPRVRRWRTRGLAAVFVTAAILPAPAGAARVTTVATGLETPVVEAPDGGLFVLTSNRVAP